MDGLDPASREEIGRIGGAIRTAAPFPLVIANPITYYDEVHTRGVDIPQPEGSFVMFYLGAKLR